MKRQKVYRKVSAGFLWILSSFILVPIYLAVINSFKTKQDAAKLNLALPEVWNGIENYSQMMTEGKILHSFFNSCIVTVISVAIIIFCAATLGFVIERKKTAFSRVLNIFVMIGLVLPIQIIPTYYIVHAMNLPNNLAYVLVMAATNLSLCTFLYVGYFKSIPVEIDESASLDGAGAVKMFFYIIFPLTKPVTITAVIISFMSVWNDFGVSIYFLNNVKYQTLPLTVYNFFGNHNSDWQLVFANVVFATLPVAIVYLFLQRHIIDGMTAGAVKS